MQALDSVSTVTCSTPVRSAAPLKTCVQSRYFAYWPAALLSYGLHGDTTEHSAPHCMSDCPEITVIVRLGLCLDTC